MWCFLLLGWQTFTVLGRSVFAKPEIDAVRWTITLQCWCHLRLSCSDLQFLGKTRINKDSFFGCFPFFLLFSFPVTVTTRMGLILRCVLLLFLSTFTVGFDFQLAPKPRQSAFVKRSNIKARAAKIVKRALPAWLAASANHGIKRRSAEQGDSCEAVQGLDTKLANNTHSVSYPPRSCYSCHVWQLNEQRRCCAGVDQVQEKA